jgi:hypothetical protein
VSPDTLVQDLLPMVVDSELPLRVMDDEVVMGVVDRLAVMASLIEDRG